LSTLLNILMLNTEQFFIDGVTTTRYRMPWSTLDFSERVIYDSAFLEEYLNKPLEDIRQLYPCAELVRTCYWSGTEWQNNQWHCDELEGHNVSLLCYGDTVTRGGVLEVQNTTTQKVTAVPSTKGTCAWLNNRTPFVHRVTHQRRVEPRRVISLEFASHD